MPRRSGGGFRTAPSRAGPAMRSAPPSRPVSSVPAKTAQPTTPAAPPPAASAVGQPRQPGLMAQMASTAAGVAIGSAVGHTVGAAMTGGMGGHSEAPAQQEPAYSQSQTQEKFGNCQFEMKQFMDCAQNQHDLSLCQGFSEVLKECRIRYGAQL